MQHVAETVLDQAVSVERHPVGFGNENWVVRDKDRTSQWILKVGSPASEAKWRSAHEALGLASSVGVPVPALLHMDMHDEWLVRIFTWIDGTPAATSITTLPQRRRFVASLASALQALHSLDTGSFSSRLDGSSARHDRWDDYLSFRLEHIRQRCIDTAAVDRRTLDRAGQAILDLASDVSPHARPTLCHRDLHGDNLLADDSGTLVGIIDWDTAESWDPAGEWFKLEWMLAPEVEANASDLSAAYLDDRPVPPMWKERVRLVHLVETLNLVPNAVAQGHDDFASRARQHLGDLLG